MDSIENTLYLLISLFLAVLVVSFFWKGASSAGNVPATKATVDFRLEEQELKIPVNRYWAETEERCHLQITNKDLAQCFRHFASRGYESKAHKLAILFITSEIAERRTRMG